MLSERERRQWAGIEKRLRRDPRFVVHTWATWRMPRWRVIGLGALAVLGWWLFTPLLASWWNLTDALVVAAVFTMVMGLAGWISRGGRPR